MKDQRFIELAPDEARAHFRFQSAEERSRLAVLRPDLFSTMTKSASPAAAELVEPPGAKLRIAGGLSLTVGALILVGAFFYPVSVAVSGLDGVVDISRVANLDRVAIRTLLGEAGGFILVAGATLLGAGAICGEISRTSKRSGA